MPGSSLSRPETVSSPRIAVLEAVRRGQDTVNALADALGVTDNAVRLHLVALERDGLLLRTTTRGSGRVGQPAAAYRLTEAGELALSKAYAPALVALVSSITQRLDGRTKRALFVDAGQRLASGAGTADTGSLSTRAHACVALLAALGGCATVDARSSQATISGDGCPLASAVRADPGACTIIEALVEAYAGVKATQQCEHGDTPRCRFLLTM